MFLAFAVYSNFKVYQLDVKSAFMNGELEEEVYVEQPQGLKTQNYLTLYILSSRLSMALNKHLRHGMTLSLNSYLKMVFLKVL